jgi:hypothetical protein
LALDNRDLQHAARILSLGWATHVPWIYGWNHPVFNANSGTNLRGSGVSSGFDSLGRIEYQE